MWIECIACGLGFVAARVDVAACPNCRTPNPTEARDRIRKEIEADSKHLIVPPVAVGRAIAYSSAIYRFATHGERMDMGKIESTLSASHGEAAAAHSSKLALVSGREFRGMVDERACLSMFVVSGSRESETGGQGRPWTYVYIVFRGSRGDAAETGKNPMGAGWGYNFSSTSVRQDHIENRKALGNLDWRANFDNRQKTPNWSAEPIKVHLGFLEIYSSVQVIVHKELTQLLGRYPEAAVIVTGHSLGAAQAVLCAHDINARGLCKPFCFPFCTPRVGNMHFAIDFKRRLGNQWSILWGETGSQRWFNRSINFVQDDDPVSWGGDMGFKKVMSEKSKRDIADHAGIVGKGIYAMRKKKDEAVLFYQTPNVYKLGSTWLWQRHQYTAVQKSLLGKALFN